MFNTMSSQEETIPISILYFEYGQKRNFKVVNHPCTKSATYKRISLSGIHYNNIVILAPFVSQCLNNTAFVSWLCMHSE